MELENKLEYSNEITVGIEALDHDHKKIFSLINQINDADVEQNNNVLFLIEQLVSYTKDHMQREEQMMKACGYPYLDNHRQVHELMKSQLLDHQQSCMNDFSKKTVEQLNHFLAGWWQDHILSFDKSYQFWMKDNEDSMTIANKLFEQENNKP